MWFKSSGNEIVDFLFVGIDREIFIYVLILNILLWWNSIF